MLTTPTTVNSLVKLNGEKKMKKFENFLDNRPCLFFLLCAISGIIASIFISAIFISCGSAIVCKEYDYRCNKNKIEVCVGYEWQEIQDCSDYNDAKFTCQSKDTEYFCEEQKE